jgi:NAD(P)-dependent dehydrogenase (short-subunit alcohol dehydrogenase family)
MRLTNKVAVITGAARGVGAAVAWRMAREGARVVAVDVLQQQLEAVVAEIRGAGFQATAKVADIASVEGNQGAVECAQTYYGGLDIFHCNAAVIDARDILDTTEALWERIHSVNLKGAYFGCRAAIPALMQHGGGSLILTASVLGIVGDPELSAYGASKGGLRSLCRSLAVAYGPHNIRCNTICPGDIETQMFQDFINAQPDPAAARKKVTDTYPLRRLAAPEDVADCAVFLASDESRYITGTDLIVDGGLLAKCY